MTFVVLPTVIFGDLWVNPALVQRFELAEEGRTYLYLGDAVYTIELPPDQVAALLSGTTPATIAVPGGSAA